MPDTITRKRRVEVSLYTDGMTETYNGRLLGLIDDAEFNILLSDKVTQARCKTRGAMPLKEITDNHQDLKGMRLMVVVNETDGKNEIPYLFISERLHFVSYVKPDNECGFTGITDSYLMVKERME